MKNKYLIQIKDYFDANEKKLQSKYPGLKWSRLEDDFIALKISTDKKYSLFIDKVEQGIPLEYITNRSFFYKDEFFVNESVLIPRSETEILVEKALELTSKEHINVIDIGCGSGNIILSYLKDLKSSYTALATDISAQALAIAKKNAQLLKKEIQFIQCDRLDGIEQMFDVILTNPPYIKKQADREGVHQQVLRYEPHRALFLEDSDYGMWFNHFFTQIKSLLNADGFCIMEGHEDHLELLKRKAFEVGLTRNEIIKDYTQRDRFLILRH